MPKTKKINMHIIHAMRTFATLVSTLLVFTLMAIPSFSLAQTPVLDTDGNPVRVEEDYYAAPQAGTNSGGGGLGLEGGDASTCAFDVVQVPDRTSNGLPLFFLPANPKDKVVNLSTDQNVQFNVSTTCATLSLWRIGQINVGNNNPPLYKVTAAGGVVGNPGRETLSNWFGVERFEDAYRFYYCPTVCNTCRPVCGYIGVLVRDGRRILGLTRTQPLKVTFKKA